MLRSGKCIATLARSTLYCLCANELCALLLGNRLNYLSLNGIKMRKYIDINLGKKLLASRELHGREIAKCGRYLEAKKLVGQKIAAFELFAPTGRMVRLRSSEVNAAMKKLLDAHNG